MARNVTFNINGQTLTSNVIKVDRSKLYGTSKVIVYDNKTGECETSNLYQGSLILPSGSISSVMIDKEGKYRSRSELIGYNENDEKVDKVPSIFSIENNCSKATIDDLLSTSITSVYHLDIPQEDINEWKNQFTGEEIYHFIFNYREDYEGDDGFIIRNGDEFFVAVGKKCNYEFLELENVTIEDVDEDSSIEDDLDFSMF